jgi:heat shock protein HspQ
LQSPFPACLSVRGNYIGTMSVVSQSENIPTARYGIGEMVRHRLLDFRGVIFDVDPVFANSDEWYEAIPEAMRPAKDQPFYHLLAENSETSYVAYVSQQNLVADDEGEPIDHPAIGTLFEGFDGQRYKLKAEHRH